jgi:hypothetical protein
MNVWQRFTEPARRVVFYAQEEAGKKGEKFVSTEHLLLGLIRDASCPASAVLKDMGIASIRIRAEIERQTARGDSRTAQEMQLSPRAKRVIDLAYDESRKMGHDYIGTEHILLGIIREEEGLAGRVLLSLGADIIKARQLVLVMSGGKETSSTATTTTSSTATTTTISENKVSLPKQKNIQRLPSKIGMNGVITSDEDRPLIEAAIDRDALIEILKVFQAMDAVGYQEMLDEGRMLLLALGTTVKCLSQSGAQHMSVRVYSGEHAGKIVWIFANYFEAVTGKAEAFPPVL